MTDLRRLIEGRRADFELALEKAQQRLDELNREKVELETMMAGIRAALGYESVPSRPPPALKLHEAIREVLLERGNQWTKVTALTDEINRRSLYRKRDGAKVEASQVHARTSNYGEMFEKDGPRVRLRQV